MIPYETVDEYLKKKLGESLEKGEKPTVVSGYVDWIGDAETVICGKCKCPTFVRPWLAEEIAKHHLEVRCILCVEPSDVKNQLEIDLSEIALMAG
jgi:hypothetical protein